MTEPKQNSLDTVITIYHAEGLTAQAAHEKLVKLAGNNSYTLEEVEALYTKMDQEMQGGKLKVECITDFPDHLNMKIIEELDITGRAALRKTCHLYRDFSKDVRFTIKTLGIDVSDDYVGVTGDGGFAVTYRRIAEEPRNHMMEIKNINRRLQGNFFTTAMSNLKTILVNKKLYIDKLHVKEVSRTGGYFQKFLDILESLEEKLKVKTLKADMGNLERGNSFCRLLQSLDVDTINTIEPFEPGLNPARLNHDVYDLEQWKAAKRFEGFLYLDDVGFANIAHFEYCFLNFDSEDVTVEQMMLLKDQLLLNPSLNQFKFIDVGRENTGKLLEAIQPFKSLASSLWAYFNYPNSNEKLALSVTDDHIWFKGPCYVEEP